MQCQWSATVTLALCICLFPTHLLSALPMRSTTWGQGRWLRPGMVKGRTGSMLAMKLRGAGDEMETDASRASTTDTGSAGELFDALLQADSHVDFLAHTYASGDEGVKDQAVAYMTLLMSEEGFLDNMTPMQLLQLCIKAPDLVRACARALPEQSEAAVAVGPMHTLLTGLPEAIDALSLRALLKFSNSTTIRDLAALPAGACVQDALLVLLECPAFSQRLAATDTWSRDMTEHTVLGALLRRSPMEDLPHWEDVSAQINVGDKLESAIKMAEGII